MSNDLSGNIRLLLIDDDLKLCRLIRDYLTPLGYEITAVHNGREGLAV
ncbi:MAG: DNA-binding response regulator, partial [Acidobacteria bacterium]|nr:DNA-binding response regulator [Acidobacteriota bacterium]